MTGISDRPTRAMAVPGKSSDNAREAPQAVDERTPSRRLRQPRRCWSTEHAQEGSRAVPAARPALHGRKSLTQRDDSLCPNG